MRVGAAANPVATTTAIAQKTATTTNNVEPQRTPVSRTELRGAIERAHHKLTGHAASPALIDTLTAHASLETGSGSQMFNYNFGGIKGRSPESGQTAVCRTKEVIAGREVEVRDGFRAYRSLDEGAVDYVRLMRDRFGGAVSQAEKGNVDGFAHALKQAHYYTADETKYASALRTLSGVGGGVGGATHASTTNATSHAGVMSMAALTNVTMSSSSSSAAATYPDSVELGRVLDAIARHPTHESNISSVDEEDDRDA